MYILELNFQNNCFNVSCELARIIPSLCAIRVLLTLNLLHGYSRAYTTEGLAAALRVANLILTKPIPDPILALLG